MTIRKSLAALFGLAVGVVSWPLAIISWPLVCAWYLCNEEDD